MKATAYLQVLLAYWRSIAAFLVLGLLLGAAAYTLTPARYTASTSLYVSAQAADSPTGAYQGTLLSQQRVVSYVELAKSPRVLLPLIQREQLSQTPSSLAQDIDVQNVKDSTLIDVYVTADSSVTAADTANGLAENLVNLVTDLERPRNPNVAPAVELRVVEVAAPPSSKSSAGLSTFLALGALLALAIGVIVALTRDHFDTSIKSTKALEDLVKAPNLGVALYDESHESQPIVLRSDALSPRAEAFRRIRTNLQFVELDRVTKVFSVTSPSQSEGKTTTIANLALALADAGSRVVLVDADLRRPRLSDLFGLEKAVGLTSIAVGRTTVRAALQATPDPRVSLLASGPIPPNPAELLGSSRFQAILDELRGSFDFVLLDTPPVLPVVDGLSVAALADGTILVSRYAQTSSHQVEQAAAALGAVGANLVGTILTAVPPTGATQSYYSGYYRDSQPVASGEPGSLDASGTPGDQAQTRPSPMPRQSRTGSR